jgi:hypothetical protein
MARSFFRDFTRDDGSRVTVEYEVSSYGSPATYSPISGADGGDAFEIEIVSCWPSTEQYDRLLAERACELTVAGGTWPWASIWRAALWLDRFVLAWRIKRLERRAQLSASESERFEANVAEFGDHFPDDDDCDERGF